MTIPKVYKTAAIVLRQRTAGRGRQDPHPVHAQPRQARRRGQGRAPAAQQARRTCRAADLHVVHARPRPRAGHRHAGADHRGLPAVARGPGAHRPRSLRGRARRPLHAGATGELPGLPPVPGDAAPPGDGGAARHNAALLRDAPARLPGLSAANGGMRPLRQDAGAGDERLERGDRAACSVRPAPATLRCRARFP